MKSMSEQLWVVENGFMTCRKAGIGQKGVTLGSTNEQFGI